MAMERTRIAKVVDDVTLSRRGTQVSGTLHLTPHHLIFVHAAPPTADGKPARPRENWITYPIIHFCTFRPSPTASRQPSSIRLRCRDFTFYCFYFNDDRKARDVYDSVKAWTCKLSGIEKLYAFSYHPTGPEKDVGGQGWSLYDPMREWRRMGLGDESRKTNWRISTINKDYSFSPTYPAVLAVPANISDNTLNYAGRYRSRARIPVLTYLHPINDCTITRSSQPLVGVRGNRSIQDEKLVAAIFNTTRAERPLSAYNSPPPEREDSGSNKDTNCAVVLDGEAPQADAEAVEDAIISRFRGDDDAPEGSDDRRPMVYGAQQRNMIVDARPTINALVMQTQGMGSEDMSNYKFATKAYLGIDNVHVMRDSLQKVIDAFRDSDLTPLGPNQELLQKSNWLKHIGLILDGSGLIARQVGLQHSHVLIHCSDGWDRTSQLSSLSQICLDPYYRTMEGFMVLVEKDWLSFGHMFKHRSGFLSSEKWFQIENERISRGSEDTDGKEEKSGPMATFENAFLTAKGFFSNTKNNESRESINVDSDADASGNYDSESQQGRRIVSASGKKEKEKPITKVKETSPVFHQFLDATYQLLYQYPTRFEFSERFLRRLLFHLYSCQYGTFLGDNEKERKELRLSERTRSVWDYFLARKPEFLNAKYDPVIDDNVRGKERLIFPRPDEVRWWNELFGRTDDEMNAKPQPLIKPQSNGAGEAGVTELWTSVSDAGGSQAGYSTSMSAPVSRARTPVLVGVETSEGSVGLTSSLSAKLSSKMHESAAGGARIPGLSTPALDMSRSGSRAASPMPRESFSRSRTPVPVAPSPKPEFKSSKSPLDEVMIKKDRDDDVKTSDRLRAVKDDSSASNILSTSDQSTVMIHHFPDEQQAQSVPLPASPSLSPSVKPQELGQDREGKREANQKQDQTTEENRDIERDGSNSKIRDPAETLADDLDPLGIGEAKDIPMAQQSLSMSMRARRREQMELLMK
ncbi:uncharacterized protein Z519_03494 [Cladophialophora bantiana CBS 173.52]|uniref:Myotubularin phosphatase domain-containing protein n=1 Tax=Cladophialophora bantiana (strain ATCC 10958 / CBS 173.52 / CDC B-1940 / NIH 8579) TaxID=1442370 RepID=A0A0D2HZT7_CLAB1|nr:uncharacterized protein Z519_03494 [Cladophialophora bantiana CBS 173.52]KIW96425.1 hypothetical protein Z519_03494 [Cladophialophora bantiana CBS 173.52]